VIAAAVAAAPPIDRMKLAIIAFCFLFLCVRPHEYETWCAKVIARFEQMHTYDFEAFLTTYPKARQKRVAQCLERMK